MAAISTISGVLDSADWGSVTGGTINATHTRVTFNTNTSSSLLVGSASGWSLDEDSFRFKMHTIPTAGAPSVELRVNNATLNYLQLVRVHANSNWEFRRTISGTTVVLGTISDAHVTSNPHVQIREAGGTFYLDTSPDGTTYTNQVSGSASTMTLTNFRPRFQISAATTGTWTIQQVNGAASPTTPVSASFSTSWSVFQISRVNLIPNPSFETNADGWEVLAGSRTAAGGAHAGSYAYLLADSAPTTRSPAVPVAEGDVIFASLYTKGEGGDTGMQVVWYDDGDAELSSTDILDTNANSTTWTRAFMTAVAPEGAASAVLGISGYNYIDAVMVEVATGYTPVYETNPMFGWPYATWEAAWAGVVAEASDPYWGDISSFVTGGGVTDGASMQAWWATDPAELGDTTLAGWNDIIELNTPPPALLNPPNPDDHPYFDGDTPDGGGWSYSWSGTPHASTSIATQVAAPTPVTASVATSWSVRSVVAASVATTWDVVGLTQVTKSVATSWDVIALGSVSKSVATSWDVRQQVTASKATSWDTIALTQVTGSKATSWNVRSTITASKATTWAVRLTATRSVSTGWSVQGAPPFSPYEKLQIQVETSPGLWLTVTGDTRVASTSRHDGDPGTLNVEVLDSDLDPVTSSTIAMGKAVRIQVLSGATWKSIYTGRLNDVQVTLNPLAPAGKQTNVRLTATDNVSVLSNTPESRGVGTVNELRWLVGSTVPYVINGSSAALATGTIVARNDNASLWDQVLVTRDSNMGLAWVDGDNALRVYDSASVDASIKATIGPDVYSSLDRDFARDQIKNTVRINWRRYNVGTETSVDVPYGPYTDAASVAQWGAQEVTLTIQGPAIDEDPATIAAFAQEILDRNATAEHRPRSAVIPIVDLDTTLLARNLDLNSYVTVVYEDGVTTKTMRVTGIDQSFEVRDSRIAWFLSLEFAQADGIAQPSQTPGTGNAYNPPGSITETELDPAIPDSISDAAAAAAQALADAEAAMNFAETKNQTYRQPTAPATASMGDVWFDTDDGNHIYVWTGAWTDARDAGIGAALTAANTAQTAATTAQTTADGKNTVTYSTSAPGSAANKAGDVWFQRSGTTNNIVAQWEGLGGTSWASRKVDGLTLANLDAGTITVGTLSGTRIAADAMDGKTITGAVLQTTTLSNRGLKFTTSGMSLYDGSGNLTFALTGSSGAVYMTGGLFVGGDVSGATVTGGTVQSESTWARGIKMNSSGFTAYDSGGSPTFTITASTGAVAMKGSLTSGSSISGASITGSSFSTGGSRPLTLNAGIMSWPGGSQFYEDSSSLVISRNSAMIALSGTDTIQLFGTTYAVGTFNGSFSGTHSGSWSGTMSGGLDVSGSVTSNKLYVSSPRNDLITIPNARWVNTSSGGELCYTSHSNSSLRYKKDVDDLGLDVDTVLALRPVTYRLKADTTNTEQWGFIAEEMEGLNLRPLLGYDDEGRPDEVDYAKVCVAQQVVIRHLAERIDALEGKVA